MSRTIAGRLHRLRLADELPGRLAHDTSAELLALQLAGRSRAIGRRRRGAGSGERRPHDGGWRCRGASRSSGRQSTRPDGKARTAWRRGTSHDARSMGSSWCVPHRRAAHTRTPTHPTPTLPSSGMIVTPPQDWDVPPGDGTGLSPNATRPSLACRPSRPTSTGTRAVRVWIDDIPTRAA